MFEHLDYNHFGHRRFHSLTGGTHKTFLNTVSSSHGFRFPLPFRPLC
jgi:hypothetical protein